MVSIWCPSARCHMSSIWKTYANHMDMSYGNQMGCRVQTTSNTIWFPYGIHICAAYGRHITMLLGWLWDGSPYGKWWLDLVNCTYARSKIPVISQCRLQKLKRWQCPDYNAGRPSEREISMVTQLTNSDILHLVSEDPKRIINQSIL